MAKGSVTQRAVEAEPRVRRGYFECRYGQLHVHNAIPPGGGFEEGTPQLCIHHAGSSGRIFEKFLARAGRDRSVYAPDLPGAGESDPAPTRPSMADYAAAVGDFLESMRFRQIDVLGYQTGAFVAAELAITRPKQIRRVVMVSVPVLNDSDRDVFRRGPAAPAEDGSHLMSEWRRIQDTYGSSVALELRTRELADRLRNSVQTSWSLAAAQQYSARERLSLVPQSVLVLRPRDEFWEPTLRSRELLPKARIVDMPSSGAAVFETAPEAIVDAARDFLRG